MIDTTKIGIATARAMEKIETLVEKGYITDEATVGVACIVVALDYPTKYSEEDENLVANMTSDIIVFCEPSQIYIQTGVLELALENRNN